MAKKQSSSVPLMVAVAVLAAAFVGWFGYRTLSGPSYPKAPTSPELHSQAERLALKSGGDFSRLTPDEQRMLDNMTRGHGKKFVEMNYAKLSKSGGK